MLIIHIFLRRVLSEDNETPMEIGDFLNVILTHRF